eukprot:11718583-Alexandrium_andersonii.AAC.1
MCRSAAPFMYVRPCRRPNNTTLQSASRILWVYTGIGSNEIPQAMGRAANKLQPRPTNCSFTWPMQH